MLTYFAVGPTKEGRYMVAYMTPGCRVLTPSDDCPTLEAAWQCAAQRNAAQKAKERAIKTERIQCGIGGEYHLENLKKNRG